MSLLALRHQETPVLRINRPTTAINGPLYAVMLRSVPNLPEPGPAPCALLSALLCAQYTPEGWYWMHMDNETKQRIGEELLTSRAIVNRWYYMELQS